jgi:two-component system cell cycle sensor histidine kinase/response regulator CckA
MTAGKGNSKLEILAIDDEPEMLEVIRASLEPAGFVVHTASDPNEGLNIFEQRWRAIRLVLLDYIMPNMTGDLVFECLHNVNPDVRVLLLTGCDDNVAKKMFEAGLRGYIQKPFYIEDLIARVREETEMA